MTDTEKVALCKMLIGNYDTYDDPDSVPALETLVRNIEAVMNVEEDATVVDAEEIQAKVRELGVEEWYQPEYLCRNCGGKIMACDAEDQIAVPKRCPICEAKLELEDDTPTSCDECSWASKLYRSCADCPRYKKMKKNGKED